MNKKSFKGGFTLTELLIVILIIALLMAFILPQLLRGPAQARDLQRVSDIGRIATALESYRNSTGALPEGGCLKSGSGAGLALIQSGIFSNQNFPTDPIKGNKVGGCEAGEYSYTVVAQNGIEKNGFILAAHMESKGNGNVGTIPTAIDAAKLVKGSGDIYVKLSE